VVATGVIVGVLVIWLSTARLSFTWRMSWLAAAVVAVCASSLPSAVKLMTFIGDGIFELAHGIVAFLAAI
jgi:hypothetical protein